MERNKIENFLNTIDPNDNIVFRYIDKTGKAWLIDKEKALSSRDTNIYFLWWVRQWAERITDHDIEYTNYIRVDLDIKKWLKQYFNIEATKEDILQCIDELKDLLADNQFFKEWRYIVFSWSGCHLYYVHSNPIKFEWQMTPKIWKYAMKRIYAQFDNVLWESYPHLYADEAICNSARIMRMPGSINQKNWEMCYVVYEQDIESSLFSHILALWLNEDKRRKEENKRKAEEMAKLKADLLKSWWADTNLKYEIINRIPAYIIAQLLLPEFEFNWRKNFKTDTWFKWYFYNEETNSICNWWSREFNWWDSWSCYPNFTLVEKHLWLSKNETFKRFESKFNL